MQSCTVYITMLATLTVGAALRAEPPRERSAPTLDELLDLPSRRPAEPAKPNEQAQPGATRDDLLEIAPTDEGGTVELADEPSNEPFALAVEEMAQAAERLDQRRDAGLATQRIQQRVIRRLDQLISEAKKQRKQGSGSSRPAQPQDPPPQPASANNPGGGNPSNSSATQGGPGAPRDGRRADQPLAEQLSEWGNLPPRLRDQLMQGLQDRFSQIYQDMTERYYRRLAEEAD